MNTINLPVIYGIIPSRYGSTRFPGKPLADICGKPMVWHVYQRAIKCRFFEKVVVATDDDRIVKVLDSYEIPSVLTRDDHQSGSDRVLEAAEILSIPDDAVVINIQGDEPLLEPAILEEIVKPFENPDVCVTTPANRLDISDADNPNRVKVVLSNSGRALYFSRSLIPYNRSDENNATDCPYLAHVGLYAYRMKTLKTFVTLEPGKLEQIEKLEQLRLLENDINIDVVITGHQSIGVDSPEDLKRVESLMKGN